MVLSTSLSDYTLLTIDGYDAKIDSYTVASTDFDNMKMFYIPFGVILSKDIANYSENFSIGLNTNYTSSSNVDKFGVMGSKHDYKQPQLF